MGNSKVPTHGDKHCPPAKVKVPTRCKKHRPPAKVPVARIMAAPFSVVDYAHIVNKPSIEGVELVGNKTFAELGYNLVTDEQIDALFDDLSG